MDAKRYAEEIVDPTIEEFERDPRSQRRAFLACVATFQLFNYIPHQKSPGNNRKAFREESPAFATVDRVAHAFKHMTTGDSRNKTLPPLASGDVIMRPPAISGEAVWGLSRWDDATGGVTINGEQDRDLLMDLKTAALFLRSKLPV